MLKFTIQYGMSNRLAQIPLKVIFTILLQVVACVAAGPRTRQNHLYSPSITESLERLRRSKQVDVKRLIDENC